MFDQLANTPPAVALALGFFIAMSLRRSRLSRLTDLLLAKLGADPGRPDERIRTRAHDHDESR